MAEVDETSQQEPADASALRQALIESLGLPEHTFLVELILAETFPIVVRCHYYPTPEMVLRAVATFAEYQLVAKPAPMPEPPPPVVPPLSPLPDTAEET